MNASRDASHTLGVVLPHRAQLSSHYYSQVLKGVSDAVRQLRAHRFKLIMLRSAASRWDQRHVMTREGVDGLIITQWRTCFSTPAALHRLSIPCAVISHRDARLKAHCAGADDERGGRLAARYLYQRGHRRIAIITGPPLSSDSRLRVRGFLGYLQRVGVSVPSPWIVQGEFHEDPTVPLATALLRKHGRSISAIFCCNDNMAFGVLRASRRAGLSCPDDLSVVGYDDDPRGERSDPPLTTIHVPVYEMAREAARKLLQYLRHGRRREFLRPTTAPVTLVERCSVSRNPQIACRLNRMTPICDRRRRMI